ncbi:hypothetical protein BKA62DRAFT_719058 [Auriculariales sp. MPI-PUGE-AT-0066]|nr:hypothetical protein BKA62DRAFT_719058 [Auriculariales sp. MPI-PUGE-AT-0066]
MPNAQSSKACASDLASSSSSPSIQLTSSPTASSATTQTSASSSIVQEVKKNTIFGSKEDIPTPVGQAARIDILSNNAGFAPFNPLTVSEPFDNDALKGPEYEDEMTGQILDLLVEFRAWALAWPAFETQKVGNELSQEVNHIAVEEQRQDQLRLQLVQFVEHVRNAAQVLTNFGQP